MQHASNPIPAHAAGVGLKPAHYSQALTGDHGLDFFEVHAENFMGEGGPPHRWLSAFREKFNLSIHGVCLSIGGQSPLDADHLARLKTLVDRYQPELVSEHLAWSAHNGTSHNDLLPSPLTNASFKTVKDHVNQVQDTLGRQILMENPSLYLLPQDTTISETEFLNELAKQTGCGLLLDINNIYVSAHNIGFKAEKYVDAVDESVVKEIHLAGHVIDQLDDVTMLVDNHGAPMCDEVIELYNRFVRRAGARPTLIEWDTDIPDFDVLISETKRAKRAARGATQKEMVDA
jgi:uncharacterized protein (UPF0276 family)